ncbi:PPC domain-containing DNA-binding protein [Pelagibius sp. 7325]|uniref:PPC domain-containing DNA-binding protein n=1 Tax=Pelagibius sp. 7325 TaxID=3131994 RepID=UPI0030EC3DD5
MKWKQLNDGDLRSFAVIFDSGDEVVRDLTTFAQEQKLTAAQFTGIGAFQRVTLGFFDWESKDYEEIPVDEQVEVVALLGDIAVGADDAPALHPHVVVSRRDGSALGGHLLKGTVRPTLEVVLHETPAHLRRCKDKETGLALISI